MSGEGCPCGLGRTSEQTVDVERTRYDLASRKRGRWTSSTAPVPPGTSASACSGGPREATPSSASRRRHEDSMAGAELRAALEQCRARRPGHPHRGRGAPGGETPPRTTPRKWALTAAPARRSR